jgi:hypothetical protein
MVTLLVYKQCNHIIVDSILSIALTRGKLQATGRKLSFVSQATNNQPYLQGIITWLVKIDS